MMHWFSVCLRDYFGRKLKQMLAIVSLLLGTLEWVSRKAKNRIKLA